MSTETENDTRDYAAQRAQLSYENARDSLALEVFDGLDKRFDLSSREECFGDETLGFRFGLT